MGTGTVRVSDTTGAFMDATVDITVTSSGGLLTWAPPVGYETWPIVQLSNADTSLTLPPYPVQIDCVEPLTQNVSLDFSHDFVWIGGEVGIHNNPGGSFTNRRGLVLKQEGNEPWVQVHIEGVLFTGDWLAEGVNPGNVPTTSVTLQNIRVDRVARHGTSSQDSNAGHPDIIQLWGDTGEIRIDGFTGSSNYQGWFDGDTTPGARGVRILRRINLHGIEFMGQGPKRFFRAHRQAYCGPMQIDPDTLWVDVVPGFDPAYYAGDDVSGNYPPPDDAFQYRWGILGADGLGQYRLFRDVYLDDGRPWAIDWNGDWAKMRLGVPPEGDYVPAGTVGMGYVSPGYQ